jgi:metallophosphoesterase (TIGR00282 family)
VDILTSGDHAWDNPQIFDVLKAPELNFLCPANLEGTDPALSGREFEIGNVRILVLNLLGQVFVERKVTSPFEAVEKLLAAYKEKGKAKVILLDFHAEATSEKKAMGRYLAGKVTAVLGTHTHVQTADEEILPGGTAYLTDAGMTGAKESILGCEVESVLDQFVKGTAFKYKIAEAGPVRIEGAVIEADEEGRAVRIERIQEEVLPLD